MLFRSDLVGNEGNLFFVQRFADFYHDAGIFVVNDFVECSDVVAHNPGRYDEYKKLSGRDSEVIDFLETKSDIKDFVDEACKMVDRSVAVYRERGFTDLMVSFGCTGGRHRSVYCADCLARYIHKAYPDVRVELTHFERGIRETFNPRTEQNR